MDETYQKMLEHLKNPKNVGVIENPDGYARIKNPICGDLTDMYITIEKNRIKDVKFKTFGCLVTISSASVLSEAVKGMQINDILESKDPIKMLMNLIMKEFGNVPTEKLHCPPASIQALLIAINDYFKKKKELKKTKIIDKILENIDSYYEKGVEK